MGHSCSEKKLKFHARMFVASSKHNLRTKPDMFKVNTTYLWQPLSGVDAKVPCASVPASPSRTQSEFGLAWANEISTSKQASRYSPPSVDAQAASCFAQQARISNFSLNQQLSLSCIRSVSSRPGTRSAESINTYHADMGISGPVSAFFILRTHVPVDCFSVN